MNKNSILFIWILIVFSCNNDSFFLNKLSELYENSNASVDSLEVNLIYATDNELIKIRNLFQRNSLYAKKDSLLKLKVKLYEQEYTSNQSDASKLKKSQNNLNQNRIEQNQLIIKLKKEIQNLNIEKRNKNKYYILSYLKNRKSKFSIILDEYQNIMYLQDPELKLNDY